MRYLCIVICLVSTLHQKVAYSQAPSGGELLKLKEADTSAQIGWYGDPSLSEWGNTWQLDWSPAGYALSMQKFGYTSGSAPVVPYGFWQFDSAAQRLRYRGLLDAGGVVCSSFKGDRICVQLRMKDTEPAAAEWELNKAWAFCCYRWPDRKRLWLLKPRAGEEWCGGVFSKDDRFVVVFAKHDAQSYLLKIDAANGQELNRVPLSGVSLDSAGSSWGNMVATSDGVWLLRLISDGRELLEIPMATFQPHKVDYVASPGSFLQMTAARNADVVGLTGPNLFGGKYLVIQKTSSGWQKAIAGTFDSNTEGDQLHAMALSPDGSRALVCTESQTRLFDPLGKKVVATIKGGSKCAAFSPDGRLFALVRPSGVEMRSAADGKEIGAQATSLQHHSDVAWLRYLPDGKSLLAMDLNGIIVWDTVTKKARAKLQSLAGESGEFCFSSTSALIHQGSEIVSGDGKNFLRWKLPSPNATGTGSPLGIKPELAFPGVPKLKGGPALTSVISDRSARWMLTVNDRAAALHDLANPSVVTEVKLPAVMTTAKPVGGGTGKDGEIIFAIPSDSQRWLKVRPDAPTATEVVSSKKIYWGTPIGFLPSRQVGVHQDHQSESVNLVDVATGAIIKKLKTAVPSQQLIEVSAVSPDEKKLALIAHDSNDSLRHVLVWDLDSGELLGDQTLTSNSAQALAFSADSRRIACAHKHHAISEWDVAKLPKSISVIAKAASAVKSDQIAEKPLQTSPFIQGSATSLGSFGIKRTFAVPETGRKDFRNTIWQFHANGEVSIGETIKHAGQLLVNNGSVKSEGVCVVTHPSSKNFSDTMSTECSAMDGRVWISRYFDRPSAHGKIPTFVDTLHNITEKELRFTVAFSVPMPPETKSLIDSKFHEIEVGSNGRLSIDRDVIWAAPSLFGKPGDVLPLFRFRSQSARKESALYWDSVRHMLRAEYDIVLAPGEYQHMMHQMVEQIRAPQDLLNVFYAPLFTDMSLVTQPNVRNRGLNFGPLTKKLDTLNWRPEFENDVDLSPEPRNKDSAGFDWTAMPGMGMEGEMGGSALHLMQINGQPLPFCGASIYPTGQRVGTQLKINEPELRDIRPISSRQFLHPEFAPAPISTNSLDGTLSFERPPPVTLALGDSLWADGFNNLTMNRTTITVTYLSTFRAPPVAVWNAHGQRVPASSMTDPDSFVGVCAIEMEGEQRPATLMKFFWEGAAIKPQMRWISDRTLALDFKVFLPGQGHRKLIMVGGQRLLDTGGDIAKQLSDFDHEFTGFKTPPDPPVKRVLYLNYPYPPKE